MVKVETYDNIIFVVLSGQLTLEEAESIAQAVTTNSEKHEEIYLIGIPVNMTGFPSRLTDMLKAANTMREAQSRVKRVYGIKYNPIFSFMTSVGIQLLRLKNNTIEADNVDELFEVIEKEAQVLPTLKSSWGHYGNQIKASFAQSTLELT